MLSGKKSDMSGSNPPSDMVYVEFHEIDGNSLERNVCDFMMGKYEVSQNKYQIELGMIHTNESLQAAGSSYPVCNVTWFDAIRYCNLLSIRKKLEPCYSFSKFGSNPNKWPNNWDKDENNQSLIICDWSANGYRLPTIIEWKYAAIGGRFASNNTYSGDKDLSLVGWYKGNSNASLNIIGGLKENELGIYDMSGNVKEWCWDGNENGLRSVMGGGWKDTPECCTVESLEFRAPGNIDDTIGFRVIRSVIRKDKSKTKILPA